MRDIDPPEVEDPDRFFPDPKVLDVPRYREGSDGLYEMHRDTRGDWKEIHPIFRDLIDRLEEEPPFEAIVDGLGDYHEDHLDSRRVKEKLARKFLWQLSNLGYVEFDLPEPPERLQDRYRFVELIGRGGHGEAYLFEDLHRDEAKVVVKRPWGVKVSIHTGQRSLAQEIAAYEDLGEHPNVPEYYDSFQIRGLLHLVRDYVEGDKLTSWIRDRGPGDRAVRLEAARKVARALQAFHERDVLYLDDSPNNFMMTPDDEVVVSDLGTVTPMEDGRAPLSGARGTRGYRAQEVTNRLEGLERHATVRSEVFSFGCFYYRLVAGERRSGRWYHDDLVDALDALDAHERDRRLILACCQDQPEDRPADMAEVLDLLE